MEGAVEETSLGAVEASEALEVGRVVLVVWVVDVLPEEEVGRGVQRRL